MKTTRPVSPYVARIEALWQKNREGIIQVFPRSSGVVTDIKKYMKNVEEIYQFDAYNSLSIEGYHITPDLIEKVRNNTWDPKQYLTDNEQRNALAARGYYEAFQSVKETVRKIITIQNTSGEILESDFQDWYRQLFSPSVQAGLITPDQLFGYRRHPVYIRNSRHVPPPADAVVDCMEFLFKALKEETEASVRAVLGHYIFVFIHPYMDGNGRIARFLMNAMLSSGGYSWIVIPLVRRNEYMTAFGIADLEHDLVPFAKFVKELFRNYTFHDIVIVNTIKKIISRAGYSIKDFEITVWDLPLNGKNITLCYRKNRKCKKDFSPSFEPHERPLYFEEVLSLFSNPEEVKKVFSIR